MMALAHPYSHISSLNLPKYHLQLRNTSGQKDLRNTNIIDNATDFASCLPSMNSRVFCNNKTSQGFRGYRGGSLAAIPRHGVALKERSVIEVEPPALAQSTEGIGIKRFIRGKNFLLTGGTGFLAKAIIEKLLREIPDVGKIYVLIKAANEEAAMARLKSEIIDSELFGRLREMHKKTYSKFFSSELVPIVGDLSSSDLGMDSKQMEILSQEVDVIINSAANTTLADRYDTLINTNTKGPLKLMRFAKKCKKLCLFVHISTMYVNGERKGPISEKPFNEGESIKMDSDSIRFPYPYGGLDIKAEIKLAEDSIQEFVEKETQKMKELGLQRAKLHGWRNTYEFTKAMGEMVINSCREDIPVIIMRPSIIESSFTDPYPGWIQGNRMLDPLLLTYGKGCLPGFYANHDAIIDVVPVDMVANTIIAATAKHGIEGTPGLTVYQVGSSSTNPMSLYDFFMYAYEHFSSFPFIDAHGNVAQVEDMKFFSKMDELSSFLEVEIAHEIGLKTVQSQFVSEKINKRYNAILNNALQLARGYEPYTFGEGRYDNGNMCKLMKDMSYEERRSFDINIESLGWRNYMLNIHLPGIRKHVWKGR